MFHAFQIYDAYVSSGYCKSRSDVAYVAMTINLCYKCMFQLFQTYVTSVLSGYCICCTGYTRTLQVYVFKCFSCFKCMLQVFYLDVAYVALAIHVCCKCMFQMFQLFQTYVASVLSGCCICCSAIHICYMRML